MIVSLNNSYGASVEHSLHIFYLGKVGISCMDNTGDYFDGQP